MKFSAEVRTWIVLLLRIVLWQLALGSNCVSSDLCSNTLVCGDGVCIAGMRKGELCSISHPCRAPYVCNKGKCGTGVKRKRSCNEIENCERGLVCFEGRCRKGSNLYACDESDREPCFENMHCVDRLCRLDLHNDHSGR